MARRRPTPPAPPPDDTRSRILGAAARLFHEQGFHATGISTILREAGVNPGSLYNLFPSKDALLIGVLERYTHLLRPVVMDPVEQRTRDPIGRVFALLQQYRDWLAPIRFAMGCPIGNLALEAADNIPEARALVGRNFEGWVSVVKGWLDDAGDTLPRATDRDQLARFVLTVMEGGVMQARAAGTPAPYDHSVAQLRAYFDCLQTLAKAPATSRRKARASATPTKEKKR
jgi:AcrR family transcriptional regulator